MMLLVVGCSHKTAGLEKRELIGFQRDELDNAVGDVCKLAGVQEAMLLSTCNRVEIYAVVDQLHRAEYAITEFLCSRAGVDPKDPDGMIYCYSEKNALTHIFRVASSLDAMVVGENQIVGQVKEAFAVAEKARATGPMLRRCMHRAFSVAKLVRTETEIARHPASISSAAVDLAGRVFEDFGRVGVLVIGAGEMAELAVRHLVTSGANRIRVTNRNFQRAEELSNRVGGRAVVFDELGSQLEWADVVISSTGSREPLITREMLAEALRVRKQRPIFLVDIAVPRDVDPQAGSLANVYLFAIDDLEEAVAENLRARRKEAKTAERLVAREVIKFETWMRAQDAVPVIKQLRDRFLKIAHKEAERTAHMLRLDGDREREAIDGMAEAIVSKLLHMPTIELKRGVDVSNGVDLAQAARKLFGLEIVEEEEDNAESSEEKSK
ncbi:MAG: glutamyl-tRNA reductase [Pseudomonadota bacterium]